MIYGKFVTEKEDLETVNDIICRVLTQECGLAESGEGESFALSALLYTEEPAAAHADGEPAAAGRLLFDGDRFEIVETAVLPACRGQGYGDFLVRLLIDKALMAGAQEIRLDALAGTEGFFEKIGFVPEGEIFARGGGRWQPMVLSAGQICRCEECAPGR